MQQKIDSFQGDYRFLSNFYPCQVEYDGFIYPSSENAFQAAKTLSHIARMAFTLKDMTPAMAKGLARELQLRPNWDTIKLVVMKDILTAKFSNSALKNGLIATGKAELVEGNTWNDTFWGVCNGKGKNFLGKLLMDLRTDLAFKTTA